MRHVIIGAGAAGISAAKKLRELRPEDEILMISKDKEIYSRCLLHFYLDGRRTLEEIQFAGMNFAENSNIQWKSGEEVDKVLSEQHKIQLSGGEEIIYDKLCIASGAHTNVPPIQGLREAVNAVGFRNLEDVCKVKEILKTAENIFVMGAGLIGIDVVEGLLKYKKNITLVDMEPYMLPIQLDKKSAKKYEDLFKNAGVKQYYNVGSKEFVLDEDGMCYKVILTDGTEIPTDLIINCAGVRAETGFLQESGIECDRFGILTDETGKTSVEDIYAAGDVTGRKMIWPEAVRKGNMAAYAMCGKSCVVKDYLSEKASMNFLDVPAISIGKVNQCDETFEEEQYSGSEENYMKLLFQNGVIKGAILQGNLTHSGFLAECIRRGEARDVVQQEVKTWSGIIRSR